jgi:hypothetical protein
LADGVSAQSSRRVRRLRAARFEARLLEPLELLAHEVQRVLVREPSAAVAGDHSSHFATVETRRGFTGRSEDKKLRGFCVIA